MAPDDQPPGAPLVAAWDVISIGCQDWLNGDGPLRLRVLHVRHDANHPNIEWIHLLGYRLHGEAEGQMMMVTVRASALRGPGAVTRRDDRPADPGPPDAESHHSGA
ncbi:hypothetical protein [Micromonospora sp. NBC_01813]|uniref:hypothetical protein n=1 Tax=Micromonospora sp. NBC_01813 TaxID=2975988 RepID=UPI002DD8C0EB|nr:hypothetical protein [Micromonospora sp. NBC_01813]WSA08718.1 hypothetical protein OG958_31865 [Micromonospora sp. NBC_01813]